VEEEGLLMITVTIYINDKVIYSRSAVRMSSDEINTYEVDDGTILKHKYSDGAVPLAIKMLETIKELR